MPPIAAGSPSALHPAGTVAAQIAGLGWLLIVLAVLVVALVVGYLAWGLARGGRRRATPATPALAVDRAAERRGTATIVVAGVVVPAIVLLVVLAKTMLTLRAVLPPRATLAAEAAGAAGTNGIGGASGAALRVAIVGHDWWWEVRYPDQQVITANEIHVPVSQPVLFEVSSEDVIHSFWVPELSGKIDLIPGKVNRLVFSASEAGTFRGQCAEYCGLQHARMAFLVVAQAPDAFADWLAGQEAPATQPVDSLVQKGAQVFAREGCIACHSVRYGAQPVGGRLGPDLTHLASRSMIAAGTLQNGRANLAGWIVNSQSIKPGNGMPPMPVEGEDLQVLLDYLLSLR